MNRDDEGFLKDFFQAVADRPLEADDPAYVALHGDSDVAGPMQLLARGIEWTPEQSVQLLPGFRGTGTSTELRRLRSRLEAAGYFVVLCDLEDYFDFSTSIDAQAFLRVIAGALSGGLRGFDEDESDWNSPYPEAWVERIHGYLKEVVLGIQKLRGETTEVVLLLDSIEHAWGTASNVREVQSSVETLFVGHSKWLNLPNVHVVYTVPPFLPVQVPSLDSLYTPGGAHILPMVKLRDMAGQEDGSSFKAFAKVLIKRGDLTRLLGEQKSLETLIRYSGGIVRDLLRLLAETIRRADRLPVSPAVVDAAVAHLRNKLLPIADQDAQRLTRIAETHRAPLDDVDDEILHFSRFLAAGLVVGYQGDETWYDVHPLIADHVAAQTSEFAPREENGRPQDNEAEGDAWFAHQRETAESAHVNALVLDNICAFERLRLEFSTEQEKGQWVILLGDNGVGKSTVLRALALAALEPAMATSLLALRSPSAPLLRIGSDAGVIQLESSTGTFEVQLQKSSSVVETMRARTENGAIRPPIFAYGCQRGTALGGPERDVRFRLIDDVGSLFDHTAHLIHAETWIRRLQSSALNDRGGSAEAFFEAVQETIVDILSGVESLDVRSDQIWLRGANIGDVPLSAMSDGYITTAGWVIDLIARWADRCAREDVKLDGGFHEEMTGFVLVDEIDLHLHPLWQLEIVSKLRETFPRLSFMVTTHNPLTLLGAGPGEIHVLRREEDDRIVAQQRDIPPGTRADEVLTGFWFNLPSTLDQETLALLEEHRQRLRDGADEDDPDLRALEKKLRQGLGTFADTSLDRMALRVAAKIMDEEAATYKDVPPERREEIREEMLAELRKKRTH